MDINLPKFKQLLNFDIFEYYDTNKDLPPLEFLRKHLRQQNLLYKNDEEKRIEINQFYTLVLFSLYQSEENNLLKPESIENRKKVIERILDTEEKHDQLFEKILEDNEMIMDYGPAAIFGFMVAQFYIHNKKIF